MDTLYGVYTGIVEKNNDPEKLGRLKVRIPHVYGIIGSVVGAISVDDLPWALPYGLPAGGSADSGGCSWLPEPGDQVMVQFLDGEPEKPVWAWSMQTIDQADNFNLHLYEDGPQGTTGKPKRAAWSRYNHTIEWNPAGLIFTTQHGYRLTLTDGDNLDGQVALQTQKGQYLSLEDDVDTGTLNITDDFYMIIGQQLNISAENVRLETTTGDIAFISGSKFTVDLQDALEITGASSASLNFASSISLESTSGDMTLSAVGGISMLTPGTMEIGFAELVLGIGKSPYVLGDQLLIFLETLLLYLDTHTHSNGNLGSPTGPPLQPTTGSIAPPIELLVSETIRGQ